MKSFLFALASLAIGSAAMATPIPPSPVVNPGELMVVVPGLEFLGYSRISTVEHCAQLNGVKGDDWMELATDAEFEGMELCMREHT